MSQLKIALLTRPWTRRAHALLESVAFSGNRIVRVSEFRGEGDWWLLDDVYRHMKSTDTTEALVSECGYATALDVVARCRYLRTLPMETALRAVGAAWRACARFLDEEHPHLIVGVDIDFYLYDVLERVGRYRNSVMIGIVGTVLPGYARLTSRGALLKHRSVGGGEIDSVSAHLRNGLPEAEFVKRYKHKQGGLARRARRGLRELARLGYLKGRQVLDRDPFSFHYNAVRPKHWAVNQRMMARMPSPTIFDSIEAVRRASTSGARIVYIPLQWYPEGSYDYWVTEPWLIDALSCAVAAGQAMCSENVVVFKEHPACVGRRSGAFYEALQRVPNAVLLGIDISGGEVLDLADCVVTYGTSTGLEAALKRHAVVTISDPYFGVSEDVSVVRDLKELREIRVEKRGIRGEVNVALLESVLAGFVPGEGLLWSPDAYERQEWRVVASHIATNLQAIYAAAVAAQRSRMLAEERACRALGVRSPYFEAPTA